MMPWPAARWIVLLFLMACRPEVEQECYDPWNVPWGLGCETVRPDAFFTAWQDGQNCGGSSNTPAAGLLGSTDGGAWDCERHCGCADGSDCAADCRAAWEEGYLSCWDAAYEEGFAESPAGGDCSDV